MLKRLLVALAATSLVEPAWAATDAGAPTLPAVKGEVLEVLDGGGFTYLRLRTADGDTWAVVRRAAVNVGAQVGIDDPEPMRNFESKVLQRRFEIVVFGTLAGATGAPANAQSAVGMMPVADPHPSGGGRTGVPLVIVDKVAKADGADARTVAEVHAERLALKDRTVTIRARVVKITSGVMGKNWLHLRDDSGSAAGHDNDLVATSKDEPKIGDVVVATGVVRTDVNLGSGYIYEVLVEDASLRN